MTTFTIVKTLKSLKVELMHTAFLFMTFIISVPTYGETHNVVFVDVSGSVGGYGWESENIIGQYKKQIKNFQNTNKDVTIIPFASHILGINKNVESLTITKGNTNLKELFEYIKRNQENVDDNYNFFILTDGKHNVGVTFPELYTFADSIKSTLDSTDVYCYFVAVSEKSKQSDFATLFDGKHHFILLDSLDIPVTRTESVVKAVKINNVTTPSVKQNHKTDLTWIIWAIIILLLLLIIAAAIYYLLPLLKVMLSGLSQVDKAKLLSDLRTTPLLKKRIREDSKNIGRWRKAQLKPVDESKLAGRKLIKSFSGEEAFQFLKKNNPDIAKVIERFEKDGKGSNLGKNMYKVSVLDDGSVRVDALSKSNTYCSIIVNKDKVIASSGGFKNTKDGGMNEFLNYLMPNKTYVVNECAEYRTDKLGRVVSAYADRTKMYANPNKVNSGRYAAVQEQVVKDLDGNRNTDDGGHIFSNNVNGSNSLINQVPMDKEINEHGAWRKFEVEEEKYIKEGRDVKSYRQIIYKGSSKRPDAIRVKLVVDGKTTTEKMIKV